MTDFSETVAEWKKAKTIKYVKWHTANDDLVCEVCYERAEKEFLLTEIENLISPHEGCRCWITPIVDEDLLLERHEKVLDEIFCEIQESSRGGFLKNLFKKG